jgi:hypothetical protein
MVLTMPRSNAAGFIHPTLPFSVFVPPYITILCVRAGTPYHSLCSCRHTLPFSVFVPPYITILCVRAAIIHYHSLCSCRHTLPFAMFVPPHRERHPGTSRLWRTWLPLLQSIHSPKCRKQNKTQPALHLLASTPQHQTDQYGSTSARGAMDSDTGVSVVGWHASKNEPSHFN